MASNKVAGGLTLATLRSGLLWKVATLTFNKRARPKASG